MGRRPKKKGSAAAATAHVSSNGKSTNVAEVVHAPPSVASSDDGTDDNNDPASAKNEIAIRGRAVNREVTAVQRRPSALAVLLRSILVLLRSILLDLPLAVLFALLVFTVCLQRVKDEYLLVQLSNMKWNKIRKKSELTYYNRECEPWDLTTRNVEDLIIGDNFTTDDCLEHMMTHGASMYQNVLTEETAIALRKFVLRRNKEIPKDDQIDVIANKQRWSFYVGANDDPIIPVALREIATHPILRPALEKIAGDDPALIEMTAITSAYGAGDQFWHVDTVHKGNSLKFARSFVTSYSLFIPLQDTTAKMGATEICPGTMVCRDAEDLCEKYGFPASGSGVWKRGNGMLSNQHTYHRGTANRAKHGETRVLFILTFAPRPASSAESRMIGQGGSYSLKWNMWGHTLRDLEDATQKMAQPWATLRSFGVFKRPGSHWGWDFISIVSMRIVNSDVGYSDDDFETFLERGGLRFLPKIITEKVSREGWAEYFEGVVEESEIFLARANKIALSVYLVAVILVTLLQYIRSKSADSQRYAIRGALTRLFRTHGTIALVGLATLRHISNTDWATDIKFGRHQTSAFSGMKSDEASLKALSTTPMRSDILKGIRYDGENYGSINQFLDYHPGNRVFRASISQFSGTLPSFKSLPTTVQDRVVKTILGEMIRNRRRFLVQNDAGYWEEISTFEAQNFIMMALLKAGSDLLTELDTKIALMLAKARYGKLRSTVLSQRFVPLLLNDWRQKLFSLELGSNAPSAPTKLSSSFLPDTEESLRIGDLRQFRVFSPRWTPSRKVSSDRELPVQPDVEEVQVTNILEVGDVVEAQWEGKYNEWYKGRIEKVSESGTYDVLYADGDRNRALPQSAVRKYKPLKQEEVIEAKVPGKKRQVGSSSCQGRERERHVRRKI